MGLRLISKNISQQLLPRKTPSPKLALSWSCLCQTRNFSVATLRLKEERLPFDIPEPPRIPGSEIPASESTATTVSDVVGSVSPTVVDATGGSLENIVVSLNAAGEPSLASIGLGGWTPSGIAQQAFEMLHASGGLPWWAAILTGTLAVRLAIFPLVIGGQKNAAKLSYSMPQFQLLQEKISEAKAYGNQLEVMRLTQEMMEYMKKNDINPLRQMKLPLIQAPIFMSIFFALKSMAGAPVESLKQGGLWWFTDLTVADPYYALPVLTCATLALVMKVGIDTGSSPMASSPMTQIFLKLIPVALFPFIMSMPTDLVWYWFCANSISLAQVSFLKLPGIRERFGIPATKTWKPEELPGKKKGFVEGFKESFKNMKAAGDLKAREEAEKTRFRQAGTGPVPKTFKYDPTKSPADARKILAKRASTKS